MTESKTLDQPDLPPAPPAAADAGAERYVSPIPESCLDASGKLVRRTPEEQRRRNELAIQALRKVWDIGDEQDHRETMEFLRKALGDERTISDRKLF